MIEEPQVQRFVEPYAAFLDDGFAGPRTEWRGVGLADGATHEVIAAAHAGAAAGLRGAVTAHERDDGEGTRGDGAGKRLLFVPSAAGATLGELLDETALQGARFDTSLSIKTTIAVAAGILAHPRQAISVDHILVGFDGEILLRGRLPWWGPRRPPPVPAGMMIARVEGEAVALLGGVVASLFTSRRGLPAGFALPHVDRLVRDDVRELLVRLLENPVVPDVEELWENPPDLIRPAELDARLGRISRRIAPATDRDVAAWVRNVFAERWARERRTRDRVEALVDEHALTQATPAPPPEPTS